MPQQLPFALGPRRSVEEVSRPRDVDPENPTIDEILRSAKAAVGSSGRLLKDIETGAGLRGNTRYAAEHPEFTTGQALAETGEAMLLPLAFAGGPVGIGAQAIFGLQGLADVADPAAGGLQKVMGALSAIPGTKQARALAGKVAPGVSKLLSRGGKAKAVPSRVKGVQELDPFGSNAGDPFPLPTDAPVVPGAVRTGTAFSPGAMPQPAQEATGALGALRQAATAPTAARASRLDAEPQAEAFREAARHGTAGFSQLPELSEQELARITALLSRFGG